MGHYELKPILQNIRDDKIDDIVDQLMFRYLHGPVSKYFHTAIKALMSSNKFPSLSEKPFKTTNKPIDPDDSKVTPEKYQKYVIYIQ